MNSNTEIKLAAGALGPTFRGMMTLVGGSNYTLPSAHLEHQDNSVDAKAKRVWTHVHSKDGYVERIVTLDDAWGMTTAELQAAWQMAGDSKERDADAIGKFLMGMKGASYGVCKDITLVSKKDGNITCLHTDVDTQYDANQFEPVDLRTNVDRAHLIACGIYSVDVDRLLTLPSGTLIQMRHFLPEMVSHVDQTMDDLSKAIGEAYPDVHNVTFLIQKDDDPITEIRRRDVFYHDTESAVKFKYTTTISIYRPARGGDVPRVIECVTETRNFHGGHALANNYYEHYVTPKGGKYSQHFKVIAPEEVAKLEKYLVAPATLYMVEVTDETYEAEHAEDSEVNNKGFHLRRGKRKVSGALTFGNSFNDRETHNHRPRQRMEVSFPPALDKFFGVPWNKMMRDGPLGQRVVSDCLYRIFRQRGDAWTKMWERERDANQIRARASSSPTSSSDSDESYVDIPMPPARPTFLDIVLPVARPVASPIPVVAQPPPPPESPPESPPASPPASPPESPRVVEPPAVTTQSLLGKILGADGLLTPAEAAFLRTVFEAYTRA
jgi:hypothetical protein